MDARKRADIHVEVRGTIQSLRVEEGDRVRAKQVLAVIKSPQLKGELERSEANFARADEEFAGVAGLYEQGYVARREFEESQLALENARATVQQARESYASRLIRSPIAGTVSLRDLRYGEAVSVGKLAFQVVDLRDLLVEVSLPEKDLSKLRVGQRVEVRSGTLGTEPVAAEVGRISPVIDAGTGTVKVTIDIDSKEMRILPGMFVQADIVVDTHTDTLLLPKIALVYDGGNATVFRVEEDKAIRRKIEKGFVEADQVEVLSGLAVDDSVVVAGQSLLRDGAPIRVAD